MSRTKNIFRFTFLTAFIAGTTLLFPGCGKETTEEVKDGIEKTTDQVTGNAPIKQGEQMKDTLKKTADDYNKKAQNALENK